MSELVNQNDIKYSADASSSDSSNSSDPIVSSDSSESSGAIGSSSSSNPIVSSEFSGAIGSTNDLTWQLGFETDIGGGRENQDAHFVVENKSEGVCVLCVLDGHGRDVGRIAAVAAKGRLLQFFEESYSALATDPVQTLIEAHKVAHEHIKATFKSELESQGFQVMEDPQAPYLLKRRSSTEVWACVHGGTSCSIVAIVGNTMYIANVGDSTGTLSCTLPVLSPSLLDYIHDAGIDDPNKHGAKVVEANTYLAANTATSNTLVITTEHSPESPAEFYRLRDFKQRDGDPQQPALLVVYDSPSVDKIHCQPVFELSADGIPRVTNKGKYYKNVRKEWASLVSTPHNARFQDALAFTRSLGDFHLSTFGVSNLPEVQKIELDRVWAAMDAYVAPTVDVAPASDGTPASDATTTATTTANPTTTADGAPTIDEPMLCVVLATDGVWDNWVYADVTRFVLDPTCLKAVKDGTDGAQRVALSFMQRNGHYSKKNFGRSADNATAIIVYLQRK